MATRLWNISYHDRRVERAVTAACGPPFGMWERLRMGGTGSSRFRLVEAPPGILPHGMRTEDLGSFSMEARQKGLLLRFRDHLETMAVPFAAVELMPLRSTPEPDPSRQLRMTLGSTDGSRWVFLIDRSQRELMVRLHALACGPRDR